MKKMLLTGWMVVLGACSGAQTTGGERGDDQQLELKRQAANAQGKAEQGDVCAANGWYGDEVCDTFCRDLDVDCTVSDDDVVCLLYVEEANGSCDREPGSACIEQDPDCRGSVDPVPPDPIVCTAIAREANGVCEANPSDPCIALQDPDCAQGVACLTYVEEPNGVCEREPNDPCIFQDPDCAQGVACLTYVEEPNGACEREPNDPCIFQDPDCTQGSGGGSTPPNPGQGNGSGVACLLYIEESDGVCKREPNDPCIFQDPDCSVK